MSSGDELRELLGGTTTKPLAVARPSEWLRADGEPQLAVEDAWMSLRFAVAPTAGSLAIALLEVDREARRVATAIRRGIPPVELFGRGRRLEPVQKGLVVEEARPGSLDVTLTLGALYAVVTSQPLSFVLNTASLLGYGRVVVRAAKAGGETFVRELLVARTLPPEPVNEDETRVVIPTPYGDAELSGHFTSVRLHVRTTDDEIVDFAAEREG